MSFQQEFRTHRFGIVAGAVTGGLTAFLVRNRGVDLTPALQTQGILDVFSPFFSSSSQLAFVKVFWFFVVLFGVLGWLASKRGWLR